MPSPEVAKMFNGYVAWHGDDVVRTHPSKNQHPDFVLPTHSVCYNGKTIRDVGTPDNIARWIALFEELNPNFQGGPVDSADLGILITNWAVSEELTSVSE